MLALSFGGLCGTKKGKTLAGIAYGMYKMEKEHIHHTWTVSSAISIRNNWDVVLTNYEMPYVMVEKLSDLDYIQSGCFVLITLNKVCSYRKQLKQWIQMHNQKICLVFDESDEISNNSSVRTKAMLDCFRRCRTKLLYASKLYAALEKEETKVWQYSTPMLYSLLEQEWNNGTIRYPDV